MSSTERKEDDPFDSLLRLEDDFYKEGYELGVADGDRAGRIEGRVFGLEKGFEKYVAMGRLHGRAVVWAGRQPTADGDLQVKEQKEVKSKNDSIDPISAHEVEEMPPDAQAIPYKKPRNTRLESYVRTLYALTEPGSLSTENSEESVADFDDRLKRAEGKMKVLERLTGEHVAEGESRGISSRQVKSQSKDKSQGDGSIEDISSLHARH